MFEHIKGRDARRPIVGMWCTQVALPQMDVGVTPPFGATQPTVSMSSVATAMVAAMASDRFR